MPRYEITAECICIVNLDADSADDAREAMREYLQSNGLDADRFSLSVMAEDDQTKWIDKRGRYDMEV